MVFDIVPQQRTGFHYFPDTLHYSDRDLYTWLPELEKLGAAWLVLDAPINRAIPESFIRGLIENDITPVLHFHLPITPYIDDGSLDLLIQAYKRWGVGYMILYDRPNLRSSWCGSAWTQSDLVERFLDLYIPFGLKIIHSGMIPVFPPLEPGGDYWDTVFLRSAIRGLQRRGQKNLLEKLHIGVYSWFNSRPLNWGSGGADRWPSAQPYIDSPDYENHIGFRIFDWYKAITSAELGNPLPMMVLGVGQNTSSKSYECHPPIPEKDHAESYLSIVEALYSYPATPSDTLSGDQIIKNVGENTESLDPIPEEVISCNFWLLSTSQGSKHLSQAWYKPDGITLSSVSTVKQWSSNNSENNKSPIKLYMTPQGKVSYTRNQGNPKSAVPTPIDHYLLMPLYSWGVADWDIDRIRPFLQRYHPTVGFSYQEAQLSKRVTLTGNLNSFPSKVLNQLKASGISLEHLKEDGTLLAI